MFDCLCLNLRVSECFIMLSADMLPDFPGEVVNMRVCDRLCVSLCASVCICNCVSVSNYVFWMSVCALVCASGYTWVCVFVHVWVCLCVFLWMCVYAWMCVSVFSIELSFIVLPDFPMEDVNILCVCICDYYVCRLLCVVMCVSLCISVCLWVCGLCFQFSSMFWFPREVCE